MTKTFTAIVLAADRGTEDPVARTTSSQCKAMAPVDGTPMVLRVMESLRQSQSVDKRALCGPVQSILETEPLLLQLVQQVDTEWIEPQTSPSSSALHAMQSISDTQNVLLTTADHALLSPEIIDYFCAQSSKAGQDANYDVVVALARHSLVSQAFPGQRRTRLRFRDDDYCGCNLFAFLTPNSRRAAEVWKQAEQFRKQPARIAGIFGLSILLQYLLRRLSLDDALKRLSNRTRINIGAIIMPYAEAAVDIDTVEDLKFANRLVAQKISATEKPL